MEKEDFKGNVFFSHGKTNSCGILTAYFGKEKIPKTLEELVTMTEILTPITTDHSAVFFSLSQNKKDLSEKKEFGNLIAPLL